VVNTLDLKSSKAGSVSRFDPGLKILEGSVNRFDPGQGTYKFVNTRGSVG
jgi:hypothetical protein